MTTLIQILAFTGLFAAVSCTVCYDDLGCFDTSLDCHGKNPSTPAEIGTTFTLFTRQNQFTGDVLDRKDHASITSSRFSPNRDTKFIIHGWTSTIHKESWTDMRKALVDGDDINVVAVDWSDGAGMVYSKSVANTRVVGREVAKLIEALNEATGASFDSMHVIGHSLGAHTAGYAGEALNGNVGRVTGLDPAGPSYSGVLENACRLDRTDADFVDVLHTDGDGSGLMEELGHQDFYPNGGKKMPGCIGGCDHGRAKEYFMHSISTSCTFSSTKKGETWDDIDAGRWTSCNSRNCPQMGYRAALNKGTGAFYLETDKDSPFCQG